MEGKRRSTVALHKKVVAAYFDLINERRLNTYVTADHYVHSFIHSYLRTLHNPPKLTRLLTHFTLLSSSPLIRRPNISTPRSRPRPHRCSRPNTAIRQIRSLLLVMLDAPRLSSRRRVWRRGRQGGGEGRCRRGDSGGRLDGFCRRLVDWFFFPLHLVWFRFFFPSRF